ncbi:hypothetical protein Ais01nite_22080 [Asanoa ishikariensis]|uniref:Uncharacterized protein n=1 Tax=Asanoa ishikariensis TaxID=137265 RepID=A0A1H3RCF3_9ACTN|nr:hypothetical protein [Asanoa ishikariensis]GIF64173.1 hypothetical protein Ais01nite_22080 [Asanoa ishikariensis]SDZ23347.1 hypothetical protein SAMN05421684_3703 [Asanoa ishikariensis]
MLGSEDRGEALRDDLARLRLLAQAPEFPAGTATLSTASLTFAASLEVCQALAARLADAGVAEHARLIRHTATALMIPAPEASDAAAVAELRRLLGDLSLLLDGARTTVEGLTPSG